MVTRARKTSKTAGRAESGQTGAQATPHTPERPFVVGIGASAGGFEALEQFFSNMPHDSGVCFVVVQHLSPDHKSLMVELLSRHTRMAVRQAVEDMPFEANTVILIPPKRVMTIRDGRLHLAVREDRPIPNYPIDIFLHSLAEEMLTKAVAIILSGTGSDGSRGIRAIKEKGGMIMVQDLDTAKFDGMPRNAIATGLADYILPPYQMPEELLKYIKHPFIQEDHRAVTKLREDDDRLTQIFLMLRQATGVDFTHYKQSTVLRRIERRLSINQIGSIQDYVSFLHQTPDEVTTLYKELLIGVTNFFRDAEAFELIQKKVLPDIFRERRSVIRVWSTGCSTGEEPYSLAMLFKEYMEATGEPRDVKIFATDIDKDALEYASAGIYPENISADLSKERLQKYFIRKGDAYQIIKPLREMVIFASHNILKDPPFNKIDLLSCRNMLIYLQPVLQQKVLSFFNFALNDNAFLFLGTSETLGGMTNFFSLFDSKWKIYRSQGKHIPLDLEGFSISPVRHARPAGKAVAGRVRPEADSGMLEHIYEGLIESYVPPAVVLGEDRQLLHIIGEVSRYVKLRPGKTSFDISSLIRKDLSIAVETGINKASREGKRVVYRDVRIDDGGEPARIDLQIVPQFDETEKRKLFILLFEERRESPIKGDEEHFDLDAKARQRIKDLEHELQYTKENLQATIEEVETTNEELQATNEELLSANEELQSTNEELQSVNEELITVNAEYQNKIQELTELNNDMNNLLGATNIGVVFLDRDLCVRKFTPAAKEEINLMDFDIGRPLSHLSFNFTYDTLMSDARTVLDTLKPFEKELRGSKGKWLLLRIMPYVTMDNVIKGLVITFVDITGVREAAAEVRKLSKAVEESPAMVVITDAAGRIEYVNRAFTAVTGYEPGEVLGKNPSYVKSGLTPASEYERLWKTIGAGETWRGVFSNRRKDGGVYQERAVVAPIKSDGDGVGHYIKLSEDITERVMDEKRLDILAAIVESAPDAIIGRDMDGAIISWNTAAERLYGYSAGEMLGRNVEVLVPGEKRQEFAGIMERVRSGERVDNLVTDRLAKDGTLLRVKLSFAPIRDASGAIFGVSTRIRPA